MGQPPISRGMPAVHGDSLQLQPTSWSGTPTTRIRRRSPNQRHAELGIPSPHVALPGINPGQACPSRIPGANPIGMMPMSGGPSSATFHYCGDAPRPQSYDGQPRITHGASPETFQMPPCMNGDFYQTLQAPGGAGGGGDSSSSSSDTEESSSSSSKRNRQRPGELPDS